MALTLKQQRFCAEYIVDLNGSAAARRSGYSAHTAGQTADKLLKKAEIQAEIIRLNEQRQKATGINAERTLLEIGRLAFGDPRSVMEWGPWGVRLKESKELTADEAAMVSEVSQTTSKDGGSIKLKVWSKPDALQMLGRHLTLFTDRKEVEVSFGDLTDEQLDAKLEELRAEARRAGAASGEGEEAGEE